MTELRMMSCAACAQCVHTLMMSRQDSGVCPTVQQPEDNHSQ